jgi:hypothetical protein
MRHLLAALVLTAVIGAGVAASATASGPLPPGKLKQGNVFAANCGGDEVTLAANDGAGAAQFAHIGGHIIPVSFESTLVDVTTSTTLDNEFSPIGNGNAHRNQPTIECDIVLFDGTASDAFGTDLPPGVAPDDEILATLEVVAILKQ